jgi:hypothetical protein
MSEGVGGEQPQRGVLSDGEALPLSRLPLEFFDRMIRTGIKELYDPDALSVSRQRKVGCGRRAREVEQPGLTATVERLFESGTRGDPMSPLRWTCKSTRTLADELPRRRGVCGDRSRYSVYR